MSFSALIPFIRSQFKTPEGFIPLHEPRFVGNERKYVMDTLDIAFVSSVGAYVDKFEQMMASITGAKYAIATVNGTTALHTALLLVGVERDTEVITQSLTFAATANAIHHANAIPVFVDVDKDTMGMSPVSLKLFLENNAEVKNGVCVNKNTNRRISACVPMHTFGFPVRINEISHICAEYNIPLVEDSAESLGSYVGEKHTGTFGAVGVFSFNGNKTVTCGGGGAIVTNDEALAKRAKHITTTAKLPHPYEYVHDEVGYNYRMPNLNAALACAQLEQLPSFVENKRSLASRYADFCKEIGVTFVVEQEGTRSNYWLNTILANSRDERNEWIEYASKQGIMMRPAWTLMNKLTMYKDSPKGDLSNSEWLEDRIVNIPSSVIL